MPDASSPRLLIAPHMAPPPTLPADVRLHRLGGATMGTSWQVQAIAPAQVTAADIETAVQARLDLVIREMSTWQADSDLARFNAARPGSWHALPQGFYTVLDAALAMAWDSGGAFDPSVGPLVNLWGFGADGPRPGHTLPSTTEQAVTRARCGWQRIEFDRAARQLRQPGHLYLDFSGIAKGYAVDLVAAALRSTGCLSWLAEVGGELSGFGTKPDGQPWWVALERPPGDSAAVPAMVALHGLAIATSGDYRRYVEHGGQRYAHTIDPRSGQPVRHDLAQVTVLHPQCMVADALATVLTVLGEHEGMAFAAERNVAALFIRGVQGGRRGFVESMTPAFAAMLE